VRHFLELPLFFSKVTEKPFRLFFKSSGEININVKLNKQTATLPPIVIKGQFPAQFVECHTFKSSG
jgi:hypothetical protein